MTILRTGTGDQRSRIRWAMLAFAFFATVLNYVDRLAFNYLSAEGALRDLIPDDAFGYIGTAFFVGYLVSNFFSGFLIDRWGTRVGYALCMAFWSTASILQSLGRIPLHFGIFRALLGIGEAGNWPAAIKLTGEWFTDEERSTATGIFNSGAAIGAIITPPLIIWLSGHYGWRWTCVIIGAVGYLWLAFFWFIYYTPKNVVKESKSKQIPAKMLIKTRFVSWFTLSKVFIDPVWYFITFWIGRYLVEVHDWSLAEIGWFVMAPFIVADFGNILGGLFTQFLIKRGGIPIFKARKIAVSIFGSIMAMSLIAGPFVITSPFIALVILSFAGFGYAAYTSNTMAFPGDVVPKNAAASVWGIGSVGAGLGGVIFQSVSGYSIKHLSLSFGYEFAYNAVFVGYGLISLIGLSIILFFMGPLVKNQELFDYVQEEDSTTTEINK